MGCSNEGKYRVRRDEAKAAKEEKIKQIRIQKAVCNKLFKTLTKLLYVININLLL